MSMVKIFSLSCSNCSAPLEVSEDVEKLTCGYCGSAQILERSGGAISLKKVETAIHAVQRGTDRTAAELAIPRLLREQSDLREKRADAITAQTERYASARSGRSKLTFIVFVVVLVLGGVVKSALVAYPTASNIFSVALLAMVVGIPWFVWRTIKMPSLDTSAQVAEYDAMLMRVDQHIVANRKILDQLPH
jgi:hypothetical protein